MPKRLREENLAVIVDIGRQSTDGARRSDIGKALEEVARRKYLSGRVEPDGTILIRTSDIPH
jgi:hypothetical protein